MKSLRSMRQREKGQRVGTGPRGVRKAQTADLIAAAPDLMRSILAEPEQIRSYCAALIHDRDDPDCTGHRNAMTLIAQILRAVGSGEHVVNQLILTLGAPIEQARAAIELVNEAPTDPHEIARSCRVFLAWYEGPTGPRKDSDK